MEQQKEPLAHMDVLLDPLWVQAMIFYMLSNMQQDNTQHTSNTAVFALSRLEGYAAAEHI